MLIGIDISCCVPAPIRRDLLSATRVYSGDYINRFQLLMNVMLF